MMGVGAKALTAFVAGGDLENSVFRELVEALPVAIYTTDAGGRLTYFNAAAAKLSGRVPELGTDKWCVTWKIFLPDGTPLPHDQCPMALALKGVEVPTGIECIAERPDGTRFWFTPCPAVVRDAQGRIIGGINLLMDITDRKVSEMEANEQFRAIIETTPECVKIVASDGTLLFMNPPGLAMVGASSAEAVTGKNVYDIIAAEDRERFREFNGRICQGQKASLQFDIVGLTGARRQMETHAAPLRHLDGTTVQLAVTHDITERKCVERAALLLSAIVDSSDDGIISKGLDGVITSWNKSAERMFGYTAVEAIGQPVAALLIPPDRQKEEPDILARLRRGERVDHFETVRRRKDGSLVDISLTISPVKDTQGRIIGASKVARDITQRKRQEQALRAANAALTRSNADLQQFAYSASHDLQEPLRMVATYSELLRRDFGGQLGLGGDEYIGYTIEGALRMEQLLRDLRAYARASSADQEPTEDVDADDVLDKTLVTLERAIKDSGAAVSRTALPRVRIHAFQLDQIFQNLIGNAIHYRSEEPLRIYVAVEKREKEWLFSIRDNGIGIDPQYKEQIFEIFKRLHSTAAHPGTGMGLAICQRIVERAGGNIWVESALECGSTFFFTLPRSEGQRDCA
jgi:PAS domain S-box-containing protein